NNFGAIL
nr:Chain A, NNFGAIL peptide [unidentified]